MDLREQIVDVPDFPIKGVVFKDITPLLQNHMDQVIDQMEKLTDWKNVDVIVGIESRGFILGSALAAKLGKGFVPVRKKGKLPPPVISHEYKLEYGTDTLEIKPNTSDLKGVIIDDVLATGGTLQASAALCEKANIHIVDLLTLIDLQFLNKFEWNGLKCKSVIQYQ